jgi:hypothetical protein
MLASGECPRIVRTCVLNNTSALRPYGKAQSLTKPKMCRDPCDSINSGFPMVVHGKTLISMLISSNDSGGCRELYSPSRAKEAELF